MRKFALAVLFIAVTAASSAAYNLDFTLYNKTGYNITRMTAIPSGNNGCYFDMDTISPGRLRKGGHAKITFNNLDSCRRNSRYWDLRLYYNGRWHEFHNIPLARIYNIYVNSKNQINWD